MKAILVIDMPTRCDECRLHYTDMLGCYCILNDDEETKRYKKPNWCPLKPMPKRIGSASEYGSDEVYIKHLINWKKEIDEILGETE